MLDAFSHKIYAGIIGGSLVRGINVDNPINYTIEYKLVLANISSHQHKVHWTWILQIRIWVWLSPFGFTSIITLVVIYSTFVN